MKKELAEMLRNRGWQVRKTPVFVKRFLWFKNFWLPPFFSDEYIYITPKKKIALNFEGAIDKIRRKLQKRLAKMDKPVSEMEFELLEVAS